MSACEDCWTQASMHAAMFGGVAADHYQRILRENEAIHARAALATTDPSPAPAAPTAAEPAVVTSGDEASAGEAARCRCGTDATSLNPDEVVVHRSDGPCYIASATPTTTDETGESSHG